MQELKIENYIEIDGENIPMDSLPDDQATKICMLLMDNFMQSMGYQKKRSAG